MAKYPLLFHSVMSYGILLWAKAADIHNKFILQKRAVRVSLRFLKRLESSRWHNNILYVENHLCGLYLVWENK